MTLTPGPDRKGEVILEKGVAFVPYLLIAGAATAVEPAPIELGRDFDLAQLRPPSAPRIGTDPCRRGDPDEILVCGRRDSRGYRWQPTGGPPSAFAGWRNPFETDLGGGRLGLRAVTGTAMDGTPDKRVMVTFKSTF